MPDRMDPIFIDVDALARQQRPVPPAAYASADIIIATLREVGMDPRKAATHPLAKDMAMCWVRGEWSREQFMHACRNLLILNPSLAG